MKKYESGKEVVGKIVNLGGEMPKEEVQNNEGKGFLYRTFEAGKLINVYVVGFSLVGISMGLAYNFLKEGPHRAEYGQGIVIQEYPATRAYGIDVKTDNGIYSVYTDNDISFLKCSWADGYQKTAQSLDEELQVGDSIRFVKRYHSPNGTDEFFIRDVRPDSGTSVMSGVVSPSCIEKIQIEKK